MHRDCSRLTIDRLPIFQFYDSTITIKIRIFFAGEQCCLVLAMLFDISTDAMYHNSLNF